MSGLWDILIPSVYSRAAKLDALLEHLARQMRPGVRVLVCQDNTEMAIGDKAQLLVESSNGEYVNMIGDDDWVADSYIPAIIEALAQAPDYVSFFGRFQGQLVSYSMSSANWGDAAYTSVLPGTLQPTRRAIVTLEAFSGGNGEDRRWARAIAARNVLHTEAFIDAELYDYRWHPEDSIQTNTVRAAATVPPQPAYPFLTWIEPR